MQRAISVAISDLAESYDTEQGFRKYSCLAYSGDIDMIGPIKRIVTPRSSVGSEGGKLKCVLSTSRDMLCIGSRITGNYIPRIVNKFVYFGFPVTNKNDVKLEIKLRITLINWCYCGLNKQSSSWVNRLNSLCIYGTYMALKHGWS